MSGIVSEQQARQKEGKERNEQDGVRIRCKTKVTINVKGIWCSHRVGVGCRSQALDRNSKDIPISMDLIPTLPIACNFL